MKDSCHLTKEEFGVLKNALPASMKVYLYLKLGSEGEHIKQREIAAALDMTIRTVASALAELKSLGLIHQERFYRIPMQQAS